MDESYNPNPRLLLWLMGVVTATGLLGIIGLLSSCVPLAPPPAGAVRSSTPVITPIALQPNLGRVVVPMRLTMIPMWPFVRLVFQPDSPDSIRVLLQPIYADIRGLYLSYEQSGRWPSAGVDTLLTNTLVLKYDAELDALIDEVLKLDGAPSLPPDQRDTLKYTIVDELVYRGRKVVIDKVDPAVSISNRWVPRTPIIPPPGTPPAPPATSGEMSDSAAIIQSLMQPIDADVQRYFADPEASRSPEALDALARDLVEKYDANLEAIIEELSKAGGAPTLTADMKATLKYTLVREHIHKVFQGATYGTP